ncbi:MAG: hypothetical protein RIQ81_1433 [Pseudomonadota bacterium]|jgi:hypothetical protein
MSGRDFKKGIETVMHDDQHQQELATHDMEISNYLAGASPDERIAALRELGARGMVMPPALVSALFSLDIPVAEKLALLEVASLAGDEGLESFIFDNLVHWTQELAARALRLWAQNPVRGNRWQDLSRLAQLPGIPQRVLYTILDIAPACDGRREPVISLVKACVEPAVREPQGYLSPAFNALMLVRMYEFKIFDERVVALAASICKRAAAELVPEDKSAMAAWLYLWRFSPDTFASLASTIPGDSPQRMVGSLSADFSLTSQVQAALPARKKRSPARVHVADGGAAACLSKLCRQASGAPADGGVTTGSVWHLLLRVADPSTPERDLREHAAALRPMGGIYRMAYLRALGHRRGSDEAVLKLLDFVRSNHSPELREVARSLSAIGTPRAVQELIAMISRANADVDLQLDIASLLRRHNLQAHRAELMAAANHLAARVREGRGTGSGAEATFEVWEALLELVGNEVPAKIDSASSPVSTSTSNTVSGFEVGEMDAGLSRIIPNYSELSAEVKRALRTAWYFHRQIEAHPATSAIDLSPVIDMQYKALELLFREFFEDASSRLIQTGVIQRKLDLIGYSRPVPAKMDEFESFVAGMPVIDSIPFFSKFKLRKMLLALCQFKPGKRFTLDGLKAFGLFFFVFGRSECRFGLAGIVPVVPGTVANDRKLAEFCRLLHVFQDFRNRAAHEGFHPEAAADIQGIWRNSAEIIQTAFAIRKAFGRSGPEPGLVRGRAS